jgi:purine-cytosine permease-like protein
MIMVFTCLFVASIFGLVTLPSISQSFNGWSLAIRVSIVPYFGFILSGYFTSKIFVLRRHSQQNRKMIGVLVPFEFYFARCCV